MSRNAKAFDPNSRPDHVTAETLLIAVVELADAADRERYIRQHCGENSILQREVEQMVRDYFAADSLLESPAELALAVKSQPIERLSGDSIVRIGNYRLREQIGEGGMGVVYVADQIAPLQRRVALKIIKPGLDSHQVVARFEGERQTLAMMEHPNIASILDSGTTEDGRPYFAMELVKGVPITEFCDSRGLNNEQRLQLFIKVCAAVEHAHQKGIIHRDLKPNNILVALLDDEAVPKVIDFGVAKATSQQFADASVYTAFAQMIGTPMYMSPEQVEMNNRDVDTRSDVYALGIVLYELLTGTTPFDNQTLKQASFDEFRRIIREEVPPKPSSRLSTAVAGNDSTLKHGRRVDLRRVADSMRSELDWIVMKALDKDRRRRYQSAREMAEDVGRYLRGKAVEACPPSLVYRSRKYLLIHRHLLSAVAAVLVTAAFGMFATAWKASEATKQASLANEATTVAHEQERIAATRLGIAERVVDEMYTQFATQWIARQPQLSDSQRVFLEKAVSALGELAETQTEVIPSLFQIRAQRHLAAAHNKLGDKTAALNAYRQAVALSEKREVEHQDEPDNLVLRLEALAGLASTHKGLGQEEEQLQQALQAERLVRSIEQASEINVDLLPRYASGLRLLAAGLTNVKSHKELADDVASLCVKRSEELLERAGNNFENRYLNAQCWSAKGNQLLWWGENNEQCATVYGACCEKYESLVEERPDDLAVAGSFFYALNNRQVVLGRLNRDDEQAPLYRRMFEVTKRLFDNNPGVVSYQKNYRMALSKLAYHEYVQGNHESQARLLEESSRLAEEIFEKNPNDFAAHEGVSRAYLTIGWRKRELGEYSDAKAIYEKFRAHAELGLERFPQKASIYGSLYNANVALALVGLSQADSAACLDNLRRAKTASEHYLNHLDATETSLLELERMIGRVAFLEAIQKELRLQPTYSVNPEVEIADQAWQGLSEKALQLWASALLSSKSPVTHLRKEVDSDFLAELPKIHAAPTSFADMNTTQSEFIFYESPKRILKFLSEKLDELDAAGLREFLSMMAASSAVLCSDLDFADKLADLALARDPDSVRALQAKAWASFRKGDASKAIELLDDSQLSDLGKENLFVRAMCQYQLGDSETAARTLTAARQWWEQERPGRLQESSSASDEAFPSVWTLDRLAHEADETILRFKVGNE